MPGPHGPVPVRIYWPEGADTEVRPLPIFVHFSGGGFVVLGLNSHDHVCRMICNGAHCIVVAVDYRKAPENNAPIRLARLLADPICDLGDRVVTGPEGRLSAIVPPWGGFGHAHQQMDSEVRIVTSPRH